ncbi:hypothetical protein LOK49_LG03G01073 [Camellia lanceoleosa]|uniref:Uncharacterized protein n=1 Tax=Camellia lanceoleosa TaxID=1840588 RepID=A0ACC0IHG8_9ERIC|nr:hypothetical protein LOK49_LG03G01073 [Camellia lanceoleosa]
MTASPLLCSLLPLTAPLLSPHNAAHPLSLTNPSHFYSLSLTITTQPCQSRTRDGNGVPEIGIMLKKEEIEAFASLGLRLEMEKGQ